MVERSLQRYPADGSGGGRPRLERPEVAPDGGSGYTLIVEDDAVLQGLLAEVLAAEGCEVGVASTGADALEKARARRPDAILLDYFLPDMDGAEFVRRLRNAVGRADAAEGGSVPIILVTADYRPGRRAADLGVDALLPKPFQLDELLATLRRYVDGLS